LIIAINILLVESDSGRVRLYSLIFCVYSLMSLQSLKEIIEELPKFNQVEILKILKKSSNVTINENKNGIFVNLSLIDEEVIQEIRQYVEYVSKQSEALDKIENETSSISEMYFG